MSEQNATPTAIAPREPSAEVLAAQERALLRAMDVLPPGPMHLLLNGTAFRALKAQAKELGASAFVPDHLKPSKKQAEDMSPSQQAEYTAANVVGALMLAASLGESPFEVMANVFFVGGRPGWKTEALIARLRRQRGVTLGFRVESGPKPIKSSYKKVEWRTVDGRRQPVDVSVPFEAPDLRVTCYATGPDGRLLTMEEPQADGGVRPAPLMVSVTMAEAIADGWVSNEKYATLPERMLRYRAASYWITLYAPEVKGGIPMDLEIEHLPARETERVEVVQGQPATPYRPPALPEPVAMPEPEPVEMVSK